MITSIHLLQDLHHRLNTFLLHQRVNHWYRKILSGCLCPNSFSFRKTLELVVCYLLCKVCTNWSYKYSLIWDILRCEIFDKMQNARRRIKSTIRMTNIKIFFYSFCVLSKMPCRFIFTIAEDISPAVILVGLARSNRGDTFAFTFKRLC